MLRVSFVTKKGQGELVGAVLKLWGMDYIRSGKDGEEESEIESTCISDLIQTLSSYQGLRMFKKAFRENMIHKTRRYEDLLSDSEKMVEDAMNKIQIQIPDLKRAAGLTTSSTSDNWAIFETVSSPYHRAKERSAQFASLLQRANSRLEGSMSVDKVTSDDKAKELRDDLVEALLKLTAFSAQEHILQHVAETVSAFIKDPRLFRTRLMNIVMMGGAGVGKTTLAEAIGDVFAKAGMFVGNSLILAGRGELVGQYMGETVSKTQQFLIGNLDNGVIFIDEAYAITPWEDGKPESYGTEAATALVEFMTRYTGLYCIITAGYEKEMVRYFLPSNEGLSRRFPTKFLLRTLTSEELMDVFKRQLLRAQGIPIPSGNKKLPSEQYFTPEAFLYLKLLSEEATSGDNVLIEEADPSTRKRYTNVLSFRPRWDKMYSVFQHQAGSMANMADEAVTVLYTTITFNDILKSQKKKRKSLRPPIKRQGVETVRLIVRKRIRSIALSQSDAFISQLVQVENIILPKLKSGQSTSQAQ